MDYQTYAFALLSHSDLSGLVFTCSDGSCPYPSPTAPATISGKDVLTALAMDDISYGKYGEFSVVSRVRGEVSEMCDLMDSWDIGGYQYHL